MPSGELYRIVRGVFVWLAWFLLTLDPRHDRTYGQLRRLSAANVAARLAPMSLVLVTVVWLYARFPTQLLPWAAAGWGMGLFLGGALVAWVFVGAKLSDWYLLRLGTR